MASIDSLKIAFISLHSCPVGTLGTRDTGGMNVYIRELAGELGRQGHTVDVYTRVHDPEDPEVIELGECTRLIHLNAGSHAEINKLAVYPHVPGFACNLENYRRDHDCRYDLIFSHYWLSGLAGQYLSQWWQAPHVTMFHTLGEVKNNLGIGEDESELRIVEERALARNCEHIVASTIREKSFLVNDYAASADQVSVIPCGVNLDLFQPQDKLSAKQRLGLNGKRTILFVGRIEPLKGIEQLLKAVHLLARDKPKLIIIGGDEHNRQEIKRLQILAGELGIGELVTFLGTVRQDQMPDYYNAADVCVFPSYYESFGLVPLESLACGTPVVATDVGDLRNIIESGVSGYVLADNQPEELAAHVARVLDWANNGPRDPRAIMATVNRFGWDTIAARISRVFQGLVSRHSVPCN